MKHSIYDAIVFKKIRNILGGKVRLMISGSAPISGEILNFLKVCFSCPIIEAYGMTETSGGSVATFAGET
jgi:long-chain acyl-CoA synthetase